MTGWGRGREVVAVVLVGGGDGTEPWRGKMKAGDAEGEVGQSAGLSRQAQLCALRAAPAVPAASPWAAAAGGGELGRRGGGSGGCAQGAGRPRGYGTARSSAGMRAFRAVPRCSLPVPGPCGDAAVRMGAGMLCAVGWGKEGGRGGIPGTGGSVGASPFWGHRGDCPACRGLAACPALCCGMRRLPRSGGGGGLSAVRIGGGGGVQPC